MKAEQKTKTPQLSTTRRLNYSTEMLHLCLILSAICAIGKTKPLPDTFSYSVGVGDGGGTEFSTAHEGLITGLRIWEYPGNYITGIQMKYDSNWTDLIGSGYGNQQELEIYDKEFISQISGKYYGGYIYELMFVINTGRSFKVGRLLETHSTSIQP
ncbi:zymogen granule membrane protein 16-like [Paramisgurnus dabryanus]|uniref:zymogen granule membrane protein 16-like n=1 Tax=Paramisgurnus dabryanus TaxID=90735 RepID=UPI0031F3ECFF